jgi:hypothetical protein
MSPTSRYKPINNSFILNTLAQVFKLSYESCMRNNKGIVKGSYSRNTFICQVLSAGRTDFERLRKLFTKGKVFQRNVKDICAVRRQTESPNCSLLVDVHKNCYLLLHTKTQTLSSCMSLVCVHVGAAPVTMNTC